MSLSYSDLICFINFTNFLKLCAYKGASMCKLDICLNFAPKLFLISKITNKYDQVFLIRPLKQSLYHTWNLQYSKNYQIYLCFVTNLKDLWNLFNCFEYLILNWRLVEDMSHVLLVGTLNLDLLINQNFKNFLVKLCHCL